MDSPNVQKAQEMATSAATTAGNVASSAYSTISSSLQSGFAAAKGMIPTSNTSLKATFRPLRAPPLKRSSHTLCVVGSRAYIFGGELAPRQPVDNDMHIISLPHGELQDADYEAVPAKPSAPGGQVPCPRVGHVAAAIGNAIFVHGGRGGPSMSALEERGRVWMFDTTKRTWTALDPADEDDPAPAARSYHAATSSEHPLPPTPSNTANVLADDPPDGPKLAIPQPPAQGAHGTLFVHAGCPSSGPRATDLWAFDVAARTWSPFPDAPAPGRGGTSLAMAGRRLYRFGGFDGNTELGGAVDWLDVAVATADDKGGRGELALTPRGAWLSDAFPAHAGPAPRSVAALAPVSTGQGRHYLLVVGGETSPSNRGHDAAGKFLDDVWAFQLQPEGMTVSAVHDAAKGVLLGMQTGEATFGLVKCFNADGVLVQEGQPKPMGGRGWFASAALDNVTVGGGAGVLVHGGIDETNERIGDGWIITIE